MKTISQYKEDVSALMEKCTAIDAKAQNESRDLSDSELALKNELLDAIEDTNKIVSTLERQERIHKNLTVPEEETRKKAKSIEGAKDSREDKERFSSFGQQLAAIVNASRRGGSVDPRLYNAAAEGLGSSVPTDGGFLIQQDFTNDLLQSALSASVLAPKCRQQPISGNANGIKINGVDETSRVSSRFGGILGYWVDEASDATKSKPKFRKIELSLHKLMGLCYATDELLSDAAALEGFIRAAFPSEFAFLIDDAIYRGTGAGQPLGILNAGCLVTQAKETGQDADTIVAENVIKMSSRIFASSFPNAAWYVNQMCMPQLYTMSIAVGTGGQLVFTPPNGLSSAPYGSLLGRPVIPIEQASALGDVGDIILADMNGYILAQKGGVQADVSIHVEFVSDQQVFRFIMRVDGQPVRASALTPYKGGSGATQSHFVALAAR
jgi:HK97 family phage major capsid protein